MTAGLCLKKKGSRGLGLAELGREVVPALTIRDRNTRSSASGWREAVGVSGGGDGVRSRNVRLSHAASSRVACDQARQIPLG